MLKVHGLKGKPSNSGGRKANPDKPKRVQFTGGLWVSLEELEKKFGGKIEAKQAANQAIRDLFLNTPNNFKK